MARQGALALGIILLVIAVGFMFMGKGVKEGFALSLAPIPSYFVARGATNNNIPRPLDTQCQSGSGSVYWNNTNWQFSIDAINCTTPIGLRNIRMNGSTNYCSNRNIVPGISAGIDATSRPTIIMDCAGVQTPCTGGSTYSSTGNEPCTSCPTQNVASCTTTGFTCKAGYINSGTSCTLRTCPKGQFKNTAGNCQTCSPGTYQPNDATTVASCTTCPTGASIASCSTTDVTCNTGYNRTISGSSITCEPRSCGTNEYSPNGTNRFPDCSPCPTKATCNGSSTFTCPPNYTRTTSTCDPNDCLVGSYSTTGKEDCTACQTGFTTDRTASRARTDCKRTLSISDILTQLNHPNGKFYRITAADLNIDSPQIINEQDFQTINYNRYLNEFLANALTTARFQEPFILLNSNGEVVDRNGNIRRHFQFGLPPFTTGSINNANRAVVSCATGDVRSCTFNYINPNGGPPTTTNPCIALNAYYDFDKGFCVDNNGQRVTTRRNCGDDKVYIPNTNQCVPVLSPYLKNLPANTKGNLGPDDITGCITFNGADCIPKYQRTDGTTTTSNPCPTDRPIYNFTTNQCESSTPQIPSSIVSSCCSKTPAQAVVDPSCKPLIQTTRVRNARRCPTITANRCCLPAMSGNSTCINQGFYMDQYSFKSDSCPTSALSGFTDYKDELETMAEKRMKWYQQRKVLNI